MAVDNILFTRTYYSDGNITKDVLPSTDYGKFTNNDLLFPDIYRKISYQPLIFGH